ncbi:hypothetical protein QTP70_007141 [Hemibagrus guttatus]|uniref:ribonuclease H n=1 Tax=Hemibagrus guttatus TaxID=175788 RepID=A0AAE0RIN5_9TELE|nr:hypothetical protein QTP70_007141 [Hemibagrus guttatus]
MLPEEQIKRGTSRGMESSGILCGKTPSQSDVLDQDKDGGTRLGKWEGDPPAQVPFKAGGVPVVIHWESRVPAEKATKKAKMTLCWLQCVIIQNDVSHVYGDFHAFFEEPTRRMECTSRKSTTDAIFALRILMEKYRDGQRELHCVFVDLEKVYNRAPREELWYCMRKSGVAEKYVRVAQDMYERSRTVVRCAVGQTEEFKVEVGLHQGSALSPFLFAIVMDQLSEEVRQESPCTMMFADDIVICSESREQVEENLERWRFVLERRGMKVSRSKTEYMCVNEREGSGTVRLQGEEVKKVQEFKYLGSTVQSNGECGKEVKKRVLEVAELKMLRFSLGVTRLDRIRNEYIRGTAHVGRLGDKVREARLRWFGHVQRREKGIDCGFSQLTWNLFLEQIFFIAPCKLNFLYNAGNAPYVETKNGI